MAVLMPTFGEKFRSLIKCCILWMKEDVNLFTDAESANFDDGIVGGSSLDNIPFDVVWYAIPNETPNICTECGPLVLLIQCVYVRIVLVHPGLEWVVSATSVGLPVAGVIAHLALDRVISLLPCSDIALEWWGNITTRQK